MKLLQYARHHSQLFPGIISSITFYKPLRDCFNYYHFTEEETKAQKVEVNGHGSFISKGIDHSLCLLDAQAQGSIHSQLCLPLKTPIQCQSSQLSSTVSTAPAASGPDKCSHC